MRRTCLTCMLSFLSLIGSVTYAANAPPLAWIDQFGALAPASEAASAVDADGYIYVAGSTNGAFEGQTFAGGYADAYLRKYDPSGAVVWTRQFGTDQQEYASELYVDASHIYVYGRTNGSLPGSEGQGAGDLYVRKFDHSGSVVWTRQFGGTAGNIPTALSGVGSDLYVASQHRSGSEHVAVLRRLDLDGNILWETSFLAGWAGNIAGLLADPQGVYAVGRAKTLPGQPRSGSYLRRYDNAGAEVWTNQYGGTFAAAIARDATALYIAGVVVSPLNRAQLGKFDPTNGSSIWFRVLEAPTGGHSAYDVAVHTIGGGSTIYIAGGSFGMVFPGETSPGSYMNDAFVRAYDAAGNVIWTQQFGTPLDESAQGISVDDSGAYVVGSTNIADDAFIRKVDAADGSEIWEQRMDALKNGSAEVKAVAGGDYVYVAGGVSGFLEGQVPVGGGDAFVRQYDAAGSALWTRQFGTATTETGTGLDVSGANIYVGGTTYGAFPGETNAGGHDAYLARLDSTGSALWTKQFGTSGTERDIIVAASGNDVYVAGLTNGAFPGYSNSGSYDAFISLFDDRGREAWTHQFGSRWWDRVTAMTADAGGVYGLWRIASQSYVGRYGRNGTLAWSSAIQLEGVPTWYYTYANAIAADATGLYIAGTVDNGFYTTEAFLAKLDLSGNTLWAQLLPESNGTANAIALSGSELYVAGYAQDSYGAPYHTFVAAYDTGGTEQWVEHLLSEGYNSPGGVAAHSTGIYVGGRVSGSLANQTPGGENQAFVVRYGSGTGGPGGPGATAIQSLAADLVNVDLEAGTARNLNAKLDSALNALDDSNGRNDVAAANSLGAFINAVEALRGKKISEEDAAALIAAAEAAIALVN